MANTWRSVMNIVWAGPSGFVSRAPLERALEILSGIVVTYLVFLLPVQEQPAARGSQDLAEATQLQN
jgi:hypothetical protein